MDKQTKKIKVRIRAVSFSDLPHIKEAAFKEINVGNIELPDRNINNTRININPETNNIENEIYSAPSAQKVVEPKHFGDEENEPIGW